MRYNPDKFSRDPDNFMIPLDTARATVAVK